jgi:hypothetical protein
MKQIHKSGSDTGRIFLTTQRMTPESSAELYFGIAIALYSY